MENKVRVRFAPSPTGALHIGGVRTALYNYLFAKKHNGTFILRIEDTDQNRFVPGAEEYIIKTMNWLGFEFDEGVHLGGPHAPYRQSERKGMYRQYAEDLIASGNAYYAFDTTEELDEMRKKLEASGMSAKYDATSRMSMKNSLTLSEDETNSRLAQGDDYVIRIKLPRKEEVRFHDIIRDWVVVHTQQMDDKVLLKGDGMPTYHLANVVDDHLMGITHVIRGEEWLPSAPMHVMLYRFFGWEDTMPKFAHLPLLLKPDGNGKLSKRDGDRLGFPVFPLQWQDPTTKEISSGYRESGYLPEAVINMLALLGWHSSDNQELYTMDELIQAFSLERVSKSGAKYDLDKAKWFNHKYLQQTENSDLAAQLAPILESKGLQPSLEYIAKVVALMKEKVNFVQEIIDESMYFFIPPTQFDEQVLAKKWTSAAKNAIEKYNSRIAENETFDAPFLESLLNETAASLQLKTGQLMQPLRVAVSGVAGGPPIFELLELIGKEETTNRLNHALNFSTID
jgi:glutamyl-tRNA synthetase